MNIVYSSSDSYAEIAGISIVSLFENNKDEKDIVIYIIDNNISYENKKKLLNTANYYNRNIVFVPKVDLEKITNTKIYTGRWNIGTYFRLYLSSILPTDINRVIYIDCDTIIRQSLSEIYNINLGNCSVAGVDDCRSNLYRIDIGCEPNSIYINNGFMLIDLNKWRKQNIEDKFTEFISNRKGDCTYMDQAPLNGVLGPKNEIYELEAKYNAQRIFFDFSYKDLMKLRKPNHHLTEKEYNEAINNPVVVHFTPVFITGTRPWQKKDNHKFTCEYRKYKNMSEWKDAPYRKDDRKLKKKIMTILCRNCPKFIMIPIMSYLHATWYPKKRIKIANKILGKSKNENFNGK